MTLVLVLLVSVSAFVVGILAVLLTKQRGALREVEQKLSDATVSLQRYDAIQSVAIEMKRVTDEAEAKARALVAEAETKARALVAEADSKARAAEAAVNASQAAAKAKLDSATAEVTKTKSQLVQLEKTKLSLINQLALLQKDVEHLSLDAEIQEYGLYEPKYQFPDSPKYKQELDLIYERQKDMVKSETAARCDKSWVVEGSAARGRKMVEHELKLMLLAFNGECDALITKVRYDNLERIKDRIVKHFEKLNKIGIDKHCYITSGYLDLKFRELYLTHEYAEKKQQEAEEQRSIREQMREEEKAQRELERAQVESEREAEKYRIALEKAKRDAEKSQGEKLNKLNSEIERLNSLLVEATARKERAISNAQLTRSGYVYIVSNIGSFGEEIYKIGMTRRQDPMDRIYELGDASVPFPFDIHAMIVSDDAPKLEQMLHKNFEQRRINRVNTRKEFFRVKLEEIAAVVAQNHTGEVKYTLIAEAAEYRRSEALRQSIK